VQPTVDETKAYFPSSLGYLHTNARVRIFRVYCEDDHFIVFCTLLFQSTFTMLLTGRCFFYCYTLVTCVELLCSKFVFFVMMKERVVTVLVNSII
jgi:hypothetical protein